MDKQFEWYLLSYIKLVKFLNNSGYSNTIQIFKSSDSGSFVRGVQSFHFGQQVNFWSPTWGGGQFDLWTVWLFSTPPCPLPLPTRTNTPTLQSLEQLTEAVRWHIPGRLSAVAGLIMSLAAMLPIIRRLLEEVYFSSSSVEHTVYRVSQK